VTLGRNAKVLVVNSIVSFWAPSGVKRRIVVTYGFAHHATREVLTPEVPTATDASASLAEYGSPDSTRNMKGANVVESPKEAREKSFNLLQVFANGPWYSVTPNFGSVASGEAAGVEYAWPTGPSAPLRPA